MAFSPKHNPITVRIEQLRSCYDEFLVREDVRLFRWLVEPDEVDMIQAFVQVENAEEAQTDDLFLEFRTPFTRADSFGEGLAAELEEAWAYYREALFPKQQHMMLASVNGADDAAHPRYLLSRLETFSRKFPHFEGLVVAFLAPDDIASPKKLEQWLVQALESGIPANLRLMIVDLVNSPDFEQLAAAFPQTVHTIRPNLDMPEAMRQMAGSGDPKNPGVQYRKLFMELSQHAAKGNLEEMNRVGESAVSIALREGWPQMEVLAYFAMASGYLRKKRTEQALGVFDKAKQTAQNAWNAGDPLGANLLIQALIGKGTVLFEKKEYETAAVLYREAVVPAAAANDALSLVEAWRMAGASHEMNKAWREAWDCNQNALEAGEQLDENLRPHTTLPYVGQALLRISPQLGYHEKEEAVRHKMTALCGEKWEQTLTKNARS